MVPAVGVIHRAQKKKCICHKKKSIDTLVRQKENTIIPQGYAHGFQRMHWMESQRRKKAERAQQSADRLAITRDFPKRPCEGLVWRGEEEDF